jgi:hypothetical protein
MTKKRTFEQWLDEVDKKLRELLMGLTHEDLPDCCYYSWYEEGVSPAAAAKKAIKNMYE